MSLSSPSKPTTRKVRGWQRRYQRHRADFPVKVSLLREAGYQEVSGRCGDLAHGGMGTVLTEEIPKDEVLSLEFLLPTFPAPLVIRSIVRYRRGFMHGLEFLGLTGDQQSAIDSYCAALPLT